jgi:hypothetical protein
MEVLSPVGQVREKRTVETKLAERLPKLEGKVIGFLDNHKHNADVLLKDLAELLEERIPEIETVHVQQRGGGRQPLDEYMPSLQGCDSVVIALGD